MAKQAWNPLDLKAGDKVRLMSNFGNGPMVVGIVEEVERDVKNGFPGICYRAIGSDHGNWAYMDQVAHKVS